ncbi:uncharacterized protein FIBRA_00694 [Fibroporia radiculosa]|uniref:Uncharacterized protein n=1 Tax=Fibroporia radiculosa TaxID=599839 RepID=J4I829_9APHY|nr:uncharacterized protein FIBRA_00694 [Fibroporia radiculosa]CCL98691.1 predicted protein [Fibroporia radiculosa]
MAVPVFPIIIDDTSPTVAYAPFADTYGTPNLTAGWNPYYTDLGFSSNTGSLSTGTGVSNVGAGTSLHLTAHDGAEFAIKWNGTAVDIHGTVTAPASSSLSYTVVLDGNATTNYFSSLSSPATVNTAATDVLASFSNLADGPHELVITVRNPGTSTSASATDVDAAVAFDRAVVYIDGAQARATPSSSSTSVSPSATAIVTTTVSDDNISYHGQWTYAPDLLTSDPAEAFHTSMNIGDSARVEFNASVATTLFCRRVFEALALWVTRYPGLVAVNYHSDILGLSRTPLHAIPRPPLLRVLSDIGAVTLAGLTTPSSGTYNITLDDTLYPALSARASFTSSSPTILFYASGLDPTVIHSLEIMNAGPAQGSVDEGKYLVVLVGGVNVTRPEFSPETPTPSTSTSLSPGTIAALAVGVTLAVFAIVGVLIAVMWWRRHARRRKQEMMVNPQLSYWRSNWRKWFSHGPASVHDGEAAVQTSAEKDSGWAGERVRSSGEGGVLEIGDHSHDYDAVKEIEEDDDEAARRRLVKGKSPQRVRHASQNSDGSFSIDLPELSSTPLEYPPASFPSTPQPMSLRSQLSTLPKLSSSTSPRSPRPRGPRDMHGRDNSQGILLSHIVTPPAEGDDEEEGVPPLRVGFAEEQGRPERRTERYLSTGAFSLPYSLKQALARSADTSVVEGKDVGTSRSSGLLSFLDFSSSTSGSTSASASRNRSVRNSRSNSTRSGRNSARQSAKSQGTSSSAPSAGSSVPPERRMSLGLSMTIAGGPTASQPSLTPDISLQPVPLPPTVSIPLTSHPRDVSDPDRLFPDPANMLPSPTDSIPLTVSDIHFRHSSTTSHLSDSRRTSAVRTSGSHRPAHPPLPGQYSGPSSPTEAHREDRTPVVRQAIVQKLMGIQPGPASSSSTTATPTNSPTIPAASTPTLAPVPAPAPAAGHRRRPSVADALSAGGSPATLSFGQISSAFGFGSRR